MINTFVKKHTEISDDRLNRFLRDLRTGTYLLDDIHTPNTMRVEQENEPVSVNTTQITCHGLPEINLTQFHLYRNNIYMTFTLSTKQLTDELVDQIVLSFNKQVNAYYDNESY